MKIDAALTACGGTSVGEIYGGSVEIPQGYEFVDFRFPLVGEEYIVANSGNCFGVLKGDLFRLPLTLRGAEVFRVIVAPLEV